MTDNASKEHLPELPSAPSASQKSSAAETASPANPSLESNQPKSDEASLLQALSPAPSAPAAVPESASAAQPAPAAPESASPAQPAVSPPSPPPVPSSPAASPASAAPVSSPAAAAQPKPPAQKAPTHPKCPTCGHLNRTGVLVCENCGTSLVAGDHAVIGTKRFQKNETTGEPEEIPAGDKLSTNEVKALTTAGADHFDENMILRLDVEGANTPILLSPKGETSLGRRDPATGTMPDVDFTAFAGYRLGVSRKHAIIRINDKHLEVFDLGSSNGTMINGVKLAAHHPQPLRDGDTLTLGKMNMRILYQQPKKPE